MGTTCFGEKSISVKDNDNNIKVKHTFNNNPNENNNIENSIINNQNINNNENINNIEDNKNENKNNIKQNINDAQNMNNDGSIKDDNDFIKQKEVNPYIREISIDQMQIIKNQMEKSVCKIKCNEGSGTGFFCKIPFPNFYNLLPVLITNNHILNEEDLKINNQIVLSINNDIFTYKINIDNSRKIYTEKDLYDITLIEIKESDGINLNCFLEVDNEDEAFDNETDVKKIYRNKYVYVIHYPNGDKVKYNQGTILGIEENNYTIQHKCNTKTGSSGCPIINLSNFKVIGIHKGTRKLSKCNFGTLLREPLNLFKKNFTISKEDDLNEITLIYEIQNDDEIYRRDQGFQAFKYIIEDNEVKVTKVEDKEYKSKYDESFELLIDEKSSPFKIFGEKFVENNKNICKIEISNKETELYSFISQIDITYYILEIKLKNLFNVSNMSTMLCGLNDLKSFPDISN
jgi:hypothetical protein